jgi:cobalt-zinc-cadmium resistance protein CzcA
VLYVAEMRRRQAEGHGDVRDAAVEAASVQFRPMLLLIVVALLGMMPAARAHGIGSDIQRPLATVVVGGLVSTLLLTLLALPAVYVLAERFRRPFS